MDWKDRITLDPDALVGKPVVKRTRLAVELIVLQACLACASAVLHAEKVYPLTENGKEGSRSLRSSGRGRIR